MAAMALLFAFQTLRPAPFIVLDEVDAALDAKNVDHLTSYLLKVPYQCVVISLKERLFRNSDALIGVCKPPSSVSSQALLCDLTEDLEGSKQSDRSSVISVAVSTSTKQSELSISEINNENPGPRRGNLGSADPY